MDVRLLAPTVNLATVETPELNRFVDQFLQMRAGRVFDWDSKPLRWRDAMNLMSRLYFEWSEQSRQAADRAAIYTAQAWGYRS